VRGKPQLESLGDTRMEGKLRRALDGNADYAVDQAEAYTPSNPADWADPQPTTQDEAHDRLAAAVAGLLGTPVP
jgi:hypothetical protein